MSLKLSPARVENLEHTHHVGGPLSRGEVADLLHDRHVLAVWIMKAAHHPDCGSWSPAHAATANSLYEPVRPCTCGLDALRAELTDAVPPRTQEA